MSRELEAVLDQLGRRLLPEEPRSRVRVHAAAARLGFDTRRLADKLRRKSLSVQELADLVRKWTVEVEPVAVRFDPREGWLVTGAVPSLQSWRSDRPQRGWRGTWGTCPDLS